ncbi:hypothetical protein [Jiangella mangrovi]|uniref:Alkanesulfonate monooxygenase SsuD/methylene tetrahydromethanopterin reductase-like flavin-dependent oxidoreductase (Luciferase family) n=1 Tax=Jiangella mangrovi TaxID=1524084 RepID=A0A7W9GUB8_9ACTN|nr:hypothetical protein [Jiangella mangrovi]MBB5790174.1 alkanesulfonate monooxygenase SsuD/methylene tetrahydromethanopterin reductase-like flavin-dependent oxidoreductase (luciferase family) [Jiangella mangrovi]
MTRGFELGLNSFGEVATDENGRQLSDAETVRRRVRFYHQYSTLGALFVGSPETVARKIATVARDLHLTRFDLEYDIMRLPRAARARTIELLGREVLPRVRDLLAVPPVPLSSGAL